MKTKKYFNQRNTFKSHNVLFQSTTKYEHYSSDIVNGKIRSTLPQTATVDTVFCVDDLKQTSSGRQLTYTADIAAMCSSVNDQ